MNLRRYTCVCATLVAATLSSSALAQQPQAGKTDEGDPTTEEAQPAAEPAAEPVKEAPPPKAPDKPAPSQSPVLAAPAVAVEVLPGDAYPAPRVRGIRGGSLWMNMHGHQWPYLPATAGGPATRVGFSGSVWVDNSYRAVKSGIPDTDPSVHEWRQQARMVLRFTPTYDVGNRWFVQGQGELALIGSAPAGLNDAINADDLYVRVGKWNTVDLTVGRFQGWEIMHLGMGLDLFTVERQGAFTQNNTPVDLYGVTDLWDRTTGPGKAAVHYYATNFLRFELLGLVGAATRNQLGTRPVGILDLGWLKLKVGGEYERQTPGQQSADLKGSVTKRGFGGALQFVFDPYLELGVNAAQQLVDTNNNQGVVDTGQSTTRTSLGGFINGRVVDSLLVGGGAYYTHEHNLNVNAATGENDIRKQTQLYGAVQYTFWDRFYTKFVFAYADAEFNPLSNPPPVAAFHNKSLSGRLRLMYLF
ncbi:MAG: hypothetical protein EOO73_30725 [Myxococcales bacterium]|nr:MAG: hypothetical protein EOO73_30725 [Myxococcales bacterium]